MSTNEAPLKRALHLPPDESAIARNWSAIRARHERVGRRVPWTAGVIALAAAAMLALWLAPSDGVAALTRDDGAALASTLHTPGAPAEELALADGSIIAASRQARLETLENAGGVLILALREGRARFVVTPGGPRRWFVEAGFATVEVTGTIFTVTRSTADVLVEVERGHVLVRGEGVEDRVRVLHAGESVRVTREVEAPATATEIVPRASEPAAETPAVVHAPRPHAPDDTPPDASALIAEADAARRAGDVTSALVLLDRAASLPGEAAPLASLMRGRLLLDHDRPREAAHELERAIALGLTPEMSEIADARLVEAHARAGDVDATRRAVDAYRERHPSGRSLARSQALLDGLSSP